MKKILLSSLIAVMAVSAANAKIASTDYADAVADAAEAAAMADTKTKIEALDTTVSATEGVVTGVTQADGLITGVSSAKVTSEMIADNAAIEKTQLAAAVQQSLTKADDAATAIGTEALNTAEGSYVSGKTLKGAINALDTAIKDVSGGNLKLGANAVDTDNIKDGAVTEGKLDTTLAKKINDKANSADVYTKAEINTELGADGTTGKAIKNAQNTANLAITVNNDQAEELSDLRAADIAINAKFGDLGEKTVVQAIADAQYNDTYLHNLINGNINAIREINESAAMTSGINSTKVGQIATNTTNIETNTTAINTINTSAAMTSGIDSTKVGQIATNTTNIGNNTTAINAIKTAAAGDFGTEEAYVLTATRDNNGVLQYKWEVIDRSVLN